MCLTWKIKSGILILRCKTENFDYVVSFFDPADMEQAFCLHQCHSVTDGLTISHNLTTYETFLAIPLGADAEKFNGWWNCRHGTNKDEAKVEITLSTKFSVIGKKGNCISLQLVRINIISLYHSKRLNFKFENYNHFQNLTKDKALVLFRILSKVYFNQDWKNLVSDRSDKTKLMCDFIYNI